MTEQRLGRRPRRPHGRRMARRLERTRTPALRAVTRPSRRCCEAPSAFRARSSSRSSATSSSAYGVDAPQWSLDGDGPWTATASGGEPAVRLISDCELAIEGDRVSARRGLESGEGCFCALAWGDPGRRPREPRPRSTARLKVTSDFWRDWLADGRFPDHPWRVHLQRSALTLKGLTYAPTGALLAASDDLAARDAGRGAQLGLPLQLDSRLDLHALGDAHARLRPRGARLRRVRARHLPRGGGAASDHVRDRWRARAPGEHPRPSAAATAAQSPCGSATPPTSQRQNDVYGALIDSVYIHTKSEDRLPDRGWGVIKDNVENAARIWSEPDQGIWEARGEPKHYTSSKIMCWVALDRGARIARRRYEEAERAERWAAIADEIKADILAKEFATTSCASTTTQTPSTPRCCSPRSSASCPQTTR